MNANPIMSPAGKISTNRLMLIFIMPGLIIVFLVMCAIWPHLESLVSLFVAKVLAVVGLKGNEDRLNKRPVFPEPVRTDPPTPTLPEAEVGRPKLEPTIYEAEETPETHPHLFPDGPRPRPIFRASEFAFGGSFPRALAFVLNHEAEWTKGKDGWSIRTEHDPHDPGGTTRFGVDQRSHPNVRVETLSLDGAAAIYFEEWEQTGAAKLDEEHGFSLALSYFDAAVNAGAGKARMWLAKTMDAAEFCDLREHFYTSEVRASLRARYLKGWLARLNDLRSEIGIS